MCLLTYFPPNAAVDTERLTCGAECNPHGHGYAIVTADGRVFIDHSMTPTALITNFAALRALFPDSHALFHSRITTHGSTNLSNCHPFQVVGPRGGQTILAHNGILPVDCQPKGKDNRSDTRILAEDMIWSRWSKFRLPTRGRRKPPVTRRWLDSPEVRADIERWLGRGSKVLVLTTNPRMAQTAYLFNEQLGEWVDGVWYSNSSHEPWKSRYTGFSYTYNHGSFQRATNATNAHWWKEMDDEPHVIGGKSTITGPSQGQDWEGRTWYPRESYLHHFRARKCDVCDSFRVSKHDYVCDLCGVCWLCNEYYLDCHNEEIGNRCGLTAEIRGEFDQIAGYEWSPDSEGELQQVINDLRQSRALRALPAAIKSAAASAAVFVAAEGGSDE